MEELGGDCRLLVFVRPSPVKVAPPLEARMKRFLKTGRSTEQLDEKQFSSHHGSGQIADYLLWDRRCIAEMKTINGYPAARMSRLINDALRTEPRVFVFGTVGIQRLLADRPDADEVNSAMVTIGGRPVRKMLQQSNPQIASTRSKFDLPQAAGLSIIIIDAPQKIEATVAAYAVRAALQAKEPALTQIDFVWVSIEAHQVRLPDGRLGYPELCIWKSGRRPESDRQMMGQMIDAWARSNGVEIEHLDHTVGWEVLRPVGDGWPLSLQLE
ncbi:hypothetical protein [Brevundimonas sp.]|uniref:hypothetical protein n=1 Tax=Brevundimonas sp. TaxID=1871086 RepID=UPI001A25C146|nr:hypothetical protein [Brevundimonas sp.]MBJ7484550.1 hypothetical protein [Brevundimonas sp.]